MLGSATPRHFVFDSPARFEGGRGYSRNDQKMGIRPDSNPNCGIPLIAAGRFEIRLSGGAARLSNFATSNDSIWIGAYCGLGLSLGIRSR